MFLVKLLLKDYLDFFEALTNGKKTEIYESIITNFFVSKSELAIDMDLNRAAGTNHYVD